MNTNRLTQQCITSALKVGLSLAFLLLTLTWASAQTFNGSITNTAGNSLIPSTGDGGCAAAPQTTTGTRFNATVAGLAANSIVQSVQFNFTHTFDTDIDLFLVSPSGQIIELTTDNGSLNDNYTNTVFSDGAATNITAGTAPFTGTFRPEGTLTADVCGLTVTPTVTTLSGFTPTQNGTWQALILDDLGGDSGTMLSWSITFGQPCTFDLASLPTLTFSGNTAGVCGIVNQTVTAPTHQCAGVLLSVTLDGTAIGTVASGGTFMISAPLGTHVLVYTLTAGGFTFTRTQTVIVNDAVLPTITCPANINVTLDPGACSASLNYTVASSDNCPFLGPISNAQFPATILPHGGGAITVAGNNLPGGYYFDLKNTGLTPLVIKGFQVRFGTFAIENVTSPQSVAAYYTTAATTYVGNQANAGAWTSVGPVSVPIAGPNSEFSTFNITTPIVLAPNTSKGIYLFGVNASLVYNSAANSSFTPIVNGPLTFTPGQASSGLFVAALSPRTPNVVVNYGFFVSPTPIQTAGLPSGGFFPIGTTTNCFTVADAAGNTATCCFNVTVNEFPFASTTLACNDNIQVSLDENCTAFVDASMVLEGDVYGCFDNYIVEVLRNGVYQPAVLGHNDIGLTLQVRVTDPSTGNSCWGTISVEDKLPPTITCTDITVTCGESLAPVFTPPITGQVASFNAFPNLPVGPGAGVVTTSTLPVALPTSGTISDIDVYVHLDHTWIGDLTITVIDPNGVATDLWDVQCGDFDNMNVTYDDEGLLAALCVDITNGGPGFHIQTVAAQTPGAPVLSQYDGSNPNGIWTLMITDNVGGDGGSLLNWALNITYDVVQPYAPVVSDNCDDVDLTYTDTESGDPCEGLLITRHWVATDQSGNRGTCDQLITVNPLDLTGVTCPAAYIGHCGDSTLPGGTNGFNGTGWPSVNGNPITDENNVCNIFVGYWDHTLNDCGNGTKIVRTWTILDWCTQTTLECVQVIKLQDDEAPILSCPSNVTIGTDFWYCYANFNIPLPTYEDECGSAVFLSVTSTGGVVHHFSGNNYQLANLPIGIHTVTWTATDECGNFSTCTFTVRVVDDVVPIALCDLHTVVALTNDGPNGVTLVPASVFDDGSYDACGPVTFRARRMDSCIDFDWTTGGACIDDDPGGFPPVNSNDLGTTRRPCVPFACCDVGAGPIMVELEVTDQSGNVNYCMVEIIVQDKISPFVICPPDITVSCDFWFNVIEDTFVDEDGNNNGNLDEDPLSPVFGNMYDAFQYNDDESVRQPIWINDPGNPDVSHPHLWGIDGWADDNCEVNLQVRVRVFNDCSGETLPPGGPAGAVKMIERRFSASDGNQGIAPGTCTQRIWVVDFDPFFITDQFCNLYNNDDVVWPCDVLLTECPENPGDTGEPIVYDDACSLIGVAYEDQRFNFVDGACYKILRTWSVIDWCQYNSFTGYGLWHYTQVIKVHDNEGPEFLNCPTGPVTLCLADEGVSLPNNNQVFLGHEDGTACSVHLSLCQEVHETCSDVVNYDVKFYLNNGDEFFYVKTLTSITVDSNHNASLCFDTRQNSIQAIRNNGIPYNSPFCGDYHKILWSAEDGCGNWSHCEYLIRLEDCKQPSPVCINGLSTVVMPLGGQVTIWAKDFNASSFDDCTAEEDLLYSFSGTSYTPSFTYTCDNVPAFGVELSVNIWVADGGTDDNCNGQISWNERNKDFCTTTIVITDNAHICPDTTGSVLLAGEILTQEADAVEKVAVTLTSPGHVFPTYVTVENGKYNFSNIIVPENYSLNAERNDAHRNGVSTLDLVRIQKHLLGIEPLASPYDLIAADANNSQSVSAIDLVELRKLILGIYTELPANKSWRFVDESFQFADPTHPWPFDEVIDVVNMNTSQLNKDFVAVKIGDVNNTVQANATQVLPRNDKGVVSFVALDRTVTTGEMVELAISSADFASIEGYQFTLQTQGLEFRGVESGMINMSDENMGVFGSTLTASWHKVGGVSATASDVLFTLKFQATAPGKLSTMVALNSKETAAEAYNTQDDIKGLKLTFRGAEHGAEFALYQNEPNPFKGNTVIGYDLPAAGKVTLTLFDVTGKVLMVKDQESVKGYNTISVSSKSIPSVGVLYYRLDANEYTATKKMVIIE